jgi:hypothetical protein
VRPIGKLDPHYHELLPVQKNKENLFDILRDCFNVAGDEGPPARGDPAWRCRSSWASARC